MNPFLTVLVLISDLLATLTLEEINLTMEFSLWDLWRFERLNNDEMQKAQKVQKVEKV